MPSRLYMDAAIGHSSGVTRTVLIFKAVHSKLIAEHSHVVRLHLQVELMGVVIGAYLAKFKQHAWLVPVALVFSVVAPRLLALIIIMVVPVATVAPLGIGFVGTKTSYKRSYCILHVLGFF